MKIPPSFEKGRHGQVCRHRKSLYGLKQAPRYWFTKFADALRQYGFVQSYSDYSLFTYSRKATRLNVLVYDDDLIIAARSREGIFLCQRKYALDIISEAGILESKPVTFPMEQNQKLGLSTSPELTDEDKYRQKPKEDHWVAGLRVVRYLKGSPGQGVLLQLENTLVLQGRYDSDSAACPTTRRSVTGWTVFLGSSPLSWNSKKQDTVSLSSAEVEYRAMAKLTCELKWMRGLLECVGVRLQGPMQVYYDSLSALHLARNPVFHERSKHIEIDCHFLRDALLDGTISASHVSTSSQLADIITKPLVANLFESFLSKLGIHNLHAPT
ncbi:transmembrane signal receptor [Lithospermum erythrorhizon]|uniref:Transmembrane signal receptor n=1 Tax=Lithospermum erythrorhizon TaxID=34254 RepID=A0AAV3PPJ2_LITER